VYVNRKQNYKGKGHLRNLVKWLDRIRGKEEIPTSVAFDDLDTWLDMVLETLFRGLSANADRLYKEIRTQREHLKHDIAQLQDAESTEEVPDRIVKIGMLNREKMVKHLYAVTEKIAVPTHTDYKTVLSFYTETTANLEFPFGKSETNIYCVRSLFPTEIKELIADLNRLRTLLNQLIAPTQGKESQIQQLERVPEVVRDIKELKSGIETERTASGTHEEAFSALKSEIGTDTKQLRLLEEGDAWKQFTELETNLSSLEAKLTALESNVHKLFAPLRKPLTLLQKQDETGRHTLTPEERSAISSILSSSMRALEGDVKGSLRVIKGLIEGDPAVLKDRKRESALNWLDQLLVADLATLKEKRAFLQAQTAEVSGKLSDLPIRNEKEELDRALESAQGQLTQLQDEIARSKKHIISLEEELEKNKQRLQTTLEGLSGSEIEVAFTF
jgi:predicted  nucleic acid-binding Zn-ribbon protein